MLLNYWHNQASRFERTREFVQTVYRTNKDDYSPQLLLVQSPSRDRENEDELPDDDLVPLGRSALSSLKSSIELLSEDHVRSLDSQIERHQSTIQKIARVTKWDKLLDELSSPSSEDLGDETHRHHHHRIEMLIELWKQHLVLLIINGLHL